MLVNEEIEQRLVRVRMRVAEAIKRCERDPRTVRLLAVSKTQPVSSIEEAYRAGQRAFAENRVQEWLEKAPLLPNDCEWHLVGRLQTNKVKYLDQTISMIHSLDRFSLLEALNVQGEKRGITWPTLVQVNIAEDPTKAGLTPGEVPDFLDSIRDFPYVKVRGFMTIGALEASKAETQGFFRQLQALRDTLQSRKWEGVELRELSMGMSQDFELAIEEGATFVRIGRQIFGERG
ncbi:hypothetical protein UF75_1373 [Desulfosporosinus sp. I2]|uniref:YggS family pyridoxal phosphate-dependent enzyme n=1 Tax=Desulfosporosinus sp. I2 TaxID=1617025 RepID=UPI0005EF676D|nr:YggS family pyridoxal phosphate-dependent enzyme [Desulfosporosinus sp. I2]KJR48223.1 hypothetical protein UF75_1373 [Desulfosporosinus sp. I2]